MSNIILSPLTTQEAVLSSKIEGTQATLDEVLEHEAGIDVEQEKQKDIQEIINYRSLRNRKVRRPFRAAEFNVAYQPGPSARADMPCAFSAPKSNKVYLSGYPT